MIRTDPGVQDGANTGVLEGCSEDEAGKGRCNYSIGPECCTLLCLSLQACDSSVVAQRAPDKALLTFEAG